MLPFLSCSFTARILRVRLYELIKHNVLAKECFLNQKKHFLPWLKFREMDASCYCTFKVQAIIKFTFFCFTQKR